MDSAQIEAPVDTIANCSMVTCSILLEIDGMVTTHQTGLGIAQDSLDPQELGCIPLSASRHHGLVVVALGLVHGGKADQAVREHRAARCQMIACS